MAGLDPAIFYSAADARIKCAHDAVEIVIPANAGIQLRCGPHEEASMALAHRNQCLVSSEHMRTE